MKDLKVVRGKRLLRDMVAEGEHERQDFKFAISDARKIARSLSAFANHGGGRLLIGVKDNGTIAGVRNEEDVFVVEQAAERYCRPAQQVRFCAYSYDNSIFVIVAEIDASPQRPVYAAEPDGSWKAYYRVADENIAAHPLMIEAWKLRAEPAPMAFTLDATHTRLLDLLARRGSVADSREVALALHISQEAAERAVARMAAMELVEFVFDGMSFRLGRAR